MKRFTLLFFLAVGAGSLRAQETHSLSGSITTTSGVPLDRATVHVLNTNFGSLTNESGAFFIDGILPGNYVVEISAVGFATEKKNVHVDAMGTTLSVALSEVSTQLEAVVVTAQKKEEEIQTIPSSVTALSSRQVEQYRLWNSKDITAIVPNLYSADPGDGRNVTSIRGITSTSYDPAVATYVDGVNQFGLDTYIAQLFDVERIEVLRGPQGTLYGRNAMGGVINIITKQPTNATSGFAEMNAGNYGQQRYAIGFKTPLVKNKLFLGVAGVYDQSNGFYTNLYDNSHFDKKHSLTGNYYLKYLASPKWIFTLNLKHNDNRNNGTFPLSFAALDQPFTLDQNAVSTMVDNTFNGSLTIASFGKAFNFSSQTSYQSNYRYYKKPLDEDFSPLDGLTVNNNYGRNYNYVNVITQEFKFSSAPSKKTPFQWTAGTYQAIQTSPVKQTARFGADAHALQISENDSLFSVTSTTKAVNSVLAIYGQVTYAYRKFDITTGIRYDYVNNWLRVKSEYQHDPDPTQITIQPETSISGSSSSFSPKASLSYHATNDNLIYASYNRGFRTGGLQSSDSLVRYRPEYSDNFEVGFKNTFLDNRLKFNIAAFYIQVTDVQVPTLILPSAITITRNTGNLTSKGVELELAGTLWKGLQVAYNAGINEARYTSLNLSYNGQEVNFKGNHQLFTPAMTSMLAMQYDRPIGRVRLFIRGEWMYLGDQYFDLANTIKQSSYSLLNARGGIKIQHVGKGDVTFSIWCRNLTDRKYISYAYDFGGEHLGNPKNYGVTLRYSF